MIESERVLRPLDEAGAAAARLRDYETSAQLAAALDDAWQALERTLRLLLRADPGTDDRMRMAALSAADVPVPTLIDGLRRRDLVSIELAGALHQYARALERVRAGDVRAADADLARKAIRRTRAEVHALGERSVRTVAHHAVEERAVHEPPRPVPPPARRVRNWTAAAVALALLAALALAGVLLLRPDPGLEQGIAAFRAGRLPAAESEFRRVVEREPDDVTARLYLARIYRRQGRFEDAAEQLRIAARLDPDDAAVRRELGHLFLDLGRAQPAVDQYRRALEIEPERDANWIGLIRALRIAGDPAADDVLQRAPAAVRAAMARPG